MRRVTRLIALAVGATATVMAGSLVVTPAGATASSDAAALAGSPSCMFGPASGPRTWAVSGNWDGQGGDGIGTVTISGGSLVWTLRNSPHDLPHEYRTEFGPADAVPVVGDWDGNGGDGIGYVRAVAGGLAWTVRNGAAGGAESTFHYGAPGDLFEVFAGNWDGDVNGGDGPGIRRGNQWLLRNSPTSGGAEYDFALTGFANPVGGITGNWDGDGGDGVGLYRLNAGANRTVWGLRDVLFTGGPQYGPFEYGTVNGCPITGDWDGLGGDGIGIVYPGAGHLEWHLRNGPNPGAPDYDFNYGSP